MDEYREANRRLWDEWTELHWGGAYDVAGFKAGATRLQDFESRELGDVHGKSLLHLQCHFGMDTLSWARLGASVTGADFSGRAVARARELAAGLAIDATFVESDLYQLPGRLEGTFDVVYTGRGAIGWLPDIAGWAAVVDHFLKPGGTFYMVEFHPIGQTLDDAEGVKEPLIRYPYFEREEPLRFEVVGSYADRGAKLESRFEYGWPHPLGSVVTALCERGLRLELLRELPYSVYQQYPFLVERAPRSWGLPADFPGEMPFMYSLRAGKPASA